MWRYIFGSDVNDEFNDSWDFNSSVACNRVSVLSSIIIMAKASLRCIITPFLNGDNDYKTIIDCFMFLQMEFLASLYFVHDK